MGLGKGQSSIEYLVTYGWMLIAVATVSGVVYPTLNTGCSPGTTGFSSTDVSITDEGIIDGDRFAVVVKNNRFEDITINRTTLRTNDQNITRSRDVEIKPGERSPYELVSVQDNDTSRCVEADVTMQYDVGPLGGQTIQGTATIPAKLLEAFISAGGGELVSVQINSSVMPSASSSDVICIGSDCPDRRERTDDPVLREGDTMNGSLYTNEVSFECMGDGCTEKTGSLSGQLSPNQTNMDGTLRVTELKPLSSLCLGNCPS